MKGILIESELIPAEKVKSLMSEANEILAMTVASIKTLRNKANNPKSTPPNPKSKIDSP